MKTVVENLVESSGRIRFPHTITVCLVLRPWKVVRRGMLLQVSVVGFAGRMLGGLVYEMPRAVKPCWAYHDLVITTAHTMLPL